MWRSILFILLKMWQCSFHYLTSLTGNSCLLSDIGDKKIHFKGFFLCTSVLTSRWKIFHTVQQTVVILEATHYECEMRVSQMCFRHSLASALRCFRWVIQSQLVHMDTCKGHFGIRFKYSE